MDTPTQHDLPRVKRGVAIVGCGRMGLVHAERIVTDGRAEIAGLCDADESLAAALGVQYAPQARTFTELPRLLTESRPELVLICTPTSAHFEQIAASQACGVHVLCEKPLADSRERIDRLVAVAETSVAQQAIAYQRRCWSTYRTLRREVQSGRWGPVRAVTMHVSEDWQSTIAGTWRDDPAANFGGFIGDAGSHKIDAVFFVTGLSPREVFARSWKCGSNVEVVTSVSAILGNDMALGMDFIGNAHALSEDLHVHCADADLMIRDGRAWLARGNQVEPLGPLEPDTNPVAAFLDVLDGVAENRAPFGCARPVFDFTAAVLESAASGRSVAIDAAK